MNNNSTKELIRLQKFLVGEGFGSRRNIEQMIVDKRIFINGLPAILGQKICGDENILIDEKEFYKKDGKKVLIAFNKPLGVECTMKFFSNHKTLANFNFREKGVFPIGRLDKNSEGLLLLTNDGDLANKFMHPKFKHEKEYQAEVQRNILPEMLKKLSNGSIKIAGKNVQPCKIKIINDKTFTIILKEGMKRQVREMCLACGLEVLSLKRIRIENIFLGDLGIGRCKNLSSRVFKNL